MFKRMKYSYNLYLKIFLLLFAKHKHDDDDSIFMTLQLFPVGLVGEYNLIETI